VASIHDTHWRNKMQNLSQTPVPNVRPRSPLQEPLSKYQFQVTEERPVLKDPVAPPVFTPLKCLATIDENPYPLLNSSDSEG